MKIAGGGGVMTENFRARKGSNVFNMRSKININREGTGRFGLMGMIPVLTD